MGSGSRREAARGSTGHKNREDSRREMARPMAVAPALGALTHVSSIRKITLGLSIFQGTYYTQWNYLMAASLVVMLPCLLLFFVAQKYFIQGIALTGMKG